jgi:hypothetical protein
VGVAVDFGLLRRLRDKADVLGARRDDCTPEEDGMTTKVTRVASPRSIGVDFEDGVVGGVAEAEQLVVVEVRQDGEANVVVIDSRLLHELAQPRDILLNVRSSASGSPP